MLPILHKKQEIDINTQVHQKLSVMAKVLESSNSTCRLMIELSDGRTIILQVVDPSKDPKVSKWLRNKAKISKTMKVAHAIETSQRVAGCVFRSIMKKEK